MKVELKAASFFLSQATDSSTPAIPAAVLTSQTHQEDPRANPPPTTPLMELSALSSTTDGPVDNDDIDKWFEPF